MTRHEKKSFVEQYHLDDDGKFPNNPDLPVLFYKSILNLPVFAPGSAIKKRFEKNGWSNSWRDTIYDYHHYHSNTHEVLGAYQGKTTVQLGGENGVQLIFEAGDVLIIPAGVAHKNLEPKARFKCVGAYPGGIKYDIKYGTPEERFEAFETIKNVALPAKDPVFGNGGLPAYWHPQLKMMKV